MSELKDLPAGNTPKQQMDNAFIILQYALKQSIPSQNIRNVVLEAVEHYGAAVINYARNEPKEA